MDQKKFGLFLKKLRKEKSMTQEQLAEILGVTNRSISRWENGFSMPDFDLVIELAEYYGVSIDELLEGERRTDMTNKQETETMLKAADYANAEKMILVKRLNLLFITAVLAFFVYMLLDMQNLATTGIYANIADVSLGLVLGVLLTGVLYTSRYGAKIRAFKARLKNRLKNID